MASSPRVWISRAFEAGTKYPSARVVDRDGNVCVQGDFSGSVVVRVFDMGGDDSATAVYSNTTTVAATVYSSLQPWDVDGEGFNFQTAITSNNVAWEGNHTYRVSSLLPHVTQGYIPIVHDIKIESLLSL